MKFYINQYLVFENSVAKINKIDDETVKLRKMTFGKSYHYQTKISLERLKKMYKVKKVKSVDPMLILILLKEFFQ